MATQISVDCDDDLKAQELLDDLMPAIDWWLFKASDHFGDAIEQSAGSLYEDVLLESPGMSALLPGYREAEILTTKHIIEGEPVLLLMSYTVPPGTEEGKATCYIGPEKKVRNKAEVLARTYTIEEGKIEDYPVREPKEALLRVLTPDELERYDAAKKADREAIAEMQTLRLRVRDRKLTDQKKKSPETEARLKELPPEIRLMNADELAQYSTLSSQRIEANKVMNDLRQLAIERLP
jgi:hypothetical protein